MSELMPRVRAAISEGERSPAPVIAQAARGGLEALGLRKVYTDGRRELEVFHDLSIRLNAGEGVAILGPSGSGKTTLLNLLSGLDEPTSGQVLLDGVSIHELGQREKARFISRHVGFIFQFYHLLPEFTALENVLLPVWLQEGRRDLASCLKRARELLVRVGLEDRLTHFPNQLSGGEQQRVAIARSFINDPSYLFCDEPTGNLDVQMGLQIAELLTDLFKERHKTVLIVTHDERIAKMADRVWDIMGQRWAARPL